MQTVYINYGTYVPNSQPPTLDTTPKTETLYVTPCEVTTASQERAELVEIFPVEAIYYPLSMNSRVEIGDRARHYENIKSGYCVGAQQTLSSSEEIEVYGSWLNSDCVYTQRG